MWTVISSCPPVREICGSGNDGTPCARTQAEYLNAASCGELDDLDDDVVVGDCGCDPIVTELGHAVHMRVLVVEDHKRLATALGEGLRREGMAVDLAFDGVDGLAHVNVNTYDVVVLDRDLPGVHGDEVCRKLVAEHPHTRVLMLTAASTIRDRVEGLELGADDYLPKPFDFSELVARVRALGRRSTPALPPTYERGNLKLDPARRVATRGDEWLTLSPKEFAVLECLLAADGRVVSAEELLARVWDEAVNPFTTTVKTTIARLRAKLGEPPLIETVREGGYRI
jgi:DNA-binding response OmpR family regulator